MRATTTAGAAILLAITGCTPGVYEEWADRQVYPLIDDRSERTLGYEPEVNAESPEDLAVGGDARKFVPLTIIASDAPVPVELPTAELPAGEFGPPVPVRDEPATVGTGDDATELARQFALEGLIYGPPSDSFDVPAFGLAEAIAFAAENNRDYRDEMEALYLAALDVTLQRHLFSPRPFATGSVAWSRGQESANFNTALRTVLRGGVRQQLPYGGEVTAQALVSFVDALDGTTDNAESAEVSLRAAVPLLRGAGFVNLEPLVRTERQLVYAVRDLEQFRRSLAVTVASRYFRLVNLRQSVRNNYINYLQNVRLVEQTRSQFAAGFNNLSIIQVQRAVNALLRAEDSLNDAQTAYEDALDDFKVLLGMDVTEPLEIVPQDVEVAGPSDFENGLTEAEALTFRLDLQTARDRVDDAKRRVAVTANGLLPDLDVFAEASTANAFDDPASRLDGDEAQFEAGVTFDLPVDRLAERNAYRASLISLQRAQRNVEDLEQRVLADVRSAVRQLNNARLTVRIQLSGVEVAQQRLGYAQEALRLGVAGIDTEDVVDAQDALLSAQQRLDSAEASLKIQLLQYLLDSGTLRVDPQAGVLGTALDVG